MSHGTSPEANGPRVHIAHMTNMICTCSCGKYEWVMSHTWISHVTHMNESWHISTGKWTESTLAHMTNTCTYDKHLHISQTLAHITNMISTCSCGKYEWVWQIWISVANMNEPHIAHMTNMISTCSCGKYEWVMSHTWISHVTHMNESCRTRESVTSHIWLSHGTSPKTIGGGLLSSV